MAEVTVQTSFRDEICARFKCPPEQFDRAVFRRCLYPQARSVAWLLPRRAFSDDWDMIAAVGKATSLQQVKKIVNDFRSVKPDDQSLMFIFKFRVSGRKIIDLARDIWPEAD